ncbi:MAG TPA: hypothetical protein VJ783_00535, partial [Pirellulales bacterium]|nr:hypothetical protein [Pirellulales bacterium]
ARPRRPVRRRGPAATRPGGGRWSRFPGWLPEVDPGDRVEHWAQLLLWRYGVMFRDLLARENVAPAWGDLARLYRRWEAQGQVRGGRFVSGVAGEQFALPEAIEDLRRVREAGLTGQWIVISAADPLNLAGILATGPRVPAKTRNALALLDGRVVAVHQSGETTFFEALTPELTEAIGRALRVTTVVRRQHAAGVYAGLTPRPALRAKTRKERTGRSS